MTIWSRIKYMNEKIINSISVGSGYVCSIQSRTACTAIDSFGIHIGNAGNNPLTCTTCGGDGFIETSTTFYPEVFYVRGDERIVIEAGILAQGDVILKVKTGYTLATDDQIVIDSVNFKRIHMVTDVIKTLETWFLKKIIP